MVLLPIFSLLPNGSATQSETLSTKETEEKKMVVTTAGSSGPKHRRMPGKEAFAIPSIMGALRDEFPAKENEPASHLKRASLSSPAEIKPFTQEQLTEVWKYFVEQVDAPQLKSALSSRDPLLREDWHIVYMLDNELQQQRITLELKPQLLGHLRKSLQNDALEIEFTILDIGEDKPSVPYTDAEKWQALAEKYPALIALKNRFGLDFQ